MAPLFSIPLPAVFGFQCLLVAAAFAAVLSVLTVQHKDEYDSAIKTQIEHRQRNARQALLQPFLMREPYLEQLAYQMTRKPKGMVVEEGNSTMESMVPFLDAAWPYLQLDPLVTSLCTLTETPSMVVPDTGRPRLAQMYLSKDSAVFVMGRNWTLRVNMRYPISFAPPIIPPLRRLTLPADDAPTPLFEAMMVNRKLEWHAPEVLIAGGGMPPMFLSSLSHPVVSEGGVVGAGRTISTVSLTTNLTLVHDIVESALLTSQTVALLIDTKADAMMACTDRSLSPFNTATNDTWSAGAIPNAKYRETYREAVRRCPPSTCDLLTYEAGDDIVSLLLARTESTEIRYHLLQITPRGYFYDASEKTQTAGIVIGVLCAVLVLACCVATYWAIYFPMAALQGAMSLAADMKNSEAATESGNSASVLTEIRSLQSAFVSMNQRLLVARPFLPEHLLLTAEELEELSGDEEVLTEGEEAADASTNQRSDRAAAALGLSMSGEGPSSGAPPDAGAGHSSDDRLSRSQGNTNQRTLTRNRAAAASKQDHQQSDTMSSASASRNQQGTAAASGMAALLHRTPIAQRRVGVMFCNLRDFHGLVLSGGSPSTAASAQHALAKLVESAAHRERGIIDAFQGDHFVVTFNVGRPAGNVGRAAALCGLRLASMVSKEPALAGRALGMSFASGKAMVGTMGGDSSKKLCTVGGVFTEAAALERLAKHIGADRLVLSERSLDGLDLAVYTIILGACRITSPSASTAAASATPLNRVAPPSSASPPLPPPVLVRMVTYAVTVGQSEEWLYELKVGQGSDPHTTYNRRMLAYLNRDSCDTTTSISGSGVEAKAFTAAPFEEQPCGNGVDISAWAADRLARLNAAGFGHSSYDLTTVSLLPVNTV